MKKKYEEPEMIIDRFGENDGILTADTCGAPDPGDIVPPTLDPDPWGGGGEDLNNLDNFDSFNTFCIIDSIDSLEEDQ